MHVLNTIAKQPHAAHAVHRWRQQAAIKTGTDGRITTSQGADDGREGRGLHPMWPPETSAHSAAWSGFFGSSGKSSGKRYEAAVARICLQENTTKEMINHI